jgi:hypothetical protein
VFGGRGCQSLQLNQSLCSVAAWLTERKATWHRVNRHRNPCRGCPALLHYLMPCTLAFVRQAAGLMVSDVSDAFSPVELENFRMNSPTVNISGGARRKNPSEVSEPIHCYTEPLLHCNTAKGFNVSMLQGFSASLHPCFPVPLTLCDLTWAI